MFWLLEILVKLLKIFQNKFLISKVADLEKKQVEENPKTVHDLPLVSICCITYNHASYIRQCLDGMLMQKTNFPLEMIIHDDASTDGTAQIVKEYADKYPDLIVSILQSENQHSKGFKPFANFVIPRARGKYIAICEGDDYWTDPLKLQKQVDFLERHEDFGLVHTNYKRYIEIKNLFEENPVRTINTGYIFKDLILLNQIGTLTVVARKDLVLSAMESDIFNHDLLMGDYPLWLEISTKSKIGFLKDNTAVYRVHPSSTTNSNNAQKMLEFNRSVLFIQRYYAKKYSLNDELSELIEISYYRALLNIGCTKLRKDLVNEAYSYLKNHLGYKLKYIDYIYLFGSKNKIYNRLFLMVTRVYKSFDLQKKQILK
jgi:glycosyltransferase involved in cell wall biosynthesis